MKYFTPILCVICLALGIYIGKIFTEREFGGVFEQSTVAQASMDVRLHTVVLTNLREGNTEKAIKTIEGWLTVEEALLESCSQPSCSAASKKEVTEAKELLNQYHQNFPSKESK